MNKLNEQQEKFIADFKSKFSGSNDYLSGINDATYSLLDNLLSDPYLILGELGNNGKIYPNANEGGIVNSIKYCIEVDRELEEKVILHHSFDTIPTREDVLAIVIAEDMGYDDNYGKINYYPV